MVKQARKLPFSCVSLPSPLERSFPTLAVIRVGLQSSIIPKMETTISSDLTGSVPSFQILSHYYNLLSAFLVAYLLLP